VSNIPLLEKEGWTRNQENGSVPKLRTFPGLNKIRAVIDRAYNNIEDYGSHTERHYR